MRLEVFAAGVGDCVVVGVIVGSGDGVGGCGSGHSALTVTLRGGTNAAFASSSASGLTATGGGDEAVVSLTASAIELFTVDGLEFVVGVDGVGRGRVVDGDGAILRRRRVDLTARRLSELIQTTALQSGTEVFAATDANLTIWHNNKRRRGIQFWREMDRICLRRDRTAR